MAWARRGAPAHIILKVNALTDPDLIAALYRASEAGVRIDLIVRGLCALRPGIPGVSSRITVRSIVGRFLEHSRIWFFGNGGDEQVFIGSADVMPRNFDRRIEIMAPITTPALVHRLRHEVLATQLRDPSAYTLRSDGTYHRVAPGGEPATPSQMAFLTLHGHAR
jgi:polyphosphate kinase